MFDFQVAVLNILKFSVEVKTESESSYKHSDSINIDIFVELHLLTYSKLQFYSRLLFRLCILLIMIHH